MKTRTILLLLLVGLVTIAGFKLKLDKIPHAKVPGSSIIYIPSGKHLKYATLGYSSLLADMIYIWAIQYFSDKVIPDRFAYLDHVFSIINELDPRYIDPYDIGALIAVYDVRDFATAFKILDRGLENNPKQWFFPWQAGHYAQMQLRDYKLAQKYYKIAMEIDGAPAMARRLHANATFDLSDFQTALKLWAEIYQSAKDDRVKKIASNHIYKTKAAIDTQAIKEALLKYKNLFGSYPEDLLQLVSSGLLKEIPKDLDGKDYVYDPQTGEVKGQIWWKRQ